MSLGAEGLSNGGLVPDNVCLLATALPSDNEMNKKQERYYRLHHE